MDLDIERAETAVPFDPPRKEYFCGGPIVVFAFQHRSLDAARSEKGLQTFRRKAIVRYSPLAAPSKKFLKPVKKLAAVLLRHVVEVAAAELSQLRIHEINGNTYSRPIFRHRRFGEMGALESQTFGAERVRRDSDHHSTSQEERS